MAQTIVIVVGTVTALVIVGGLTYAFLTNQLPLVFVIIATSIVVAIAVAIVYRRRSRRPRWEGRIAPKVPLQPDPKGDFLTRVQPVNVPPPEGRLKHLATVTLDTEVTPFDSYSVYLQKGDEIEVEADSEEGATFHFMVCDDDALDVNQGRTVNFEYYEGKKYTTQFKRRFGIPASGEWHFVAYTPEGEEYTTVTLTISKVE